MVAFGTVGTGACWGCGDRVAVGRVPVYCGNGNVRGPVPLPPAASTPGACTALLKLVYPCAQAPHLGSNNVAKLLTGVVG